MIQPANTESAFQALFTLVAATQLNGQPLFVTTSRRLPQSTNVAAEQQPALFQLEAEEDVREPNTGLPIEEMKAGLIVLFRTSSDQKVIASTQLNKIRDAVVNQLRSYTLTKGGVLPVIPLIPGTRQTLGGLVYHARILGKVLKNEGLQNQQGALVLPVSILTGM